jgi:hypothetical protein
MSPYQTAQLLCAVGMLFTVGVSVKIIQMVVRGVW